jgi:hypothetical protein
MKNSGMGARKAPGDVMRAIAALIVTAISVILAAGPAMAADDAGTPRDTAAGQALVARVLADHALTAEILVVLAGAALLFAYRHHGRSGNSRRSAHGRTRRPQAHARASSVAPIAADSTAANRTAGLARTAVLGDPLMTRPPRPPAAPARWRGAAPRPAVRQARVPVGQARPAAGQPLHTDDYPSWPGRPGPTALHPDHPSWPGRPDPRWAATEAALRSDGYPSWPGSRIPPLRDAEPPADDGQPGWPDDREPGWRGGREPGWRGGDGPATRREPPPGARRPPHRPPAAAPPPVLPVRVGTGFAHRADTTPRPGPVRQESPAGVLDRVRPAADWVPPERVHVWDAGSVELATWILSEANQQAADIRREARDQMAATLADARQEATDLVRKASEHAGATLAAAELEAAKVRATVTKLSTELGGVAMYVAENLVSFAPSATRPVTSPTVEPIATPTPEPVTDPEARPAARPATQPGTGPKSRPVGQPGTRPAARPGTRTAARPGTRTGARPGTRRAPERTPRQLRAFRVAAVAAAVLFLFAVGTGATELAQHGFKFFVFRETATGETGPSAPTDQQFLAQEAAAAKAAAQKAHTPGRHSGKSTSGAKPTPSAKPTSG